MIHRRHLTLAALAALALACGHGRVSFSGDPRYGKTAEEDYRYGLEELTGGNPEYAGKFFDHVRTRYPFSKYAALAELGLADVKFKQSRYIEAAEAYAQFLKQHPNHEQAPHAAFRVGLSHWKERPSDFFLLPPSEEKDLQEVRDAEVALATFVAKYPEAKERTEGERLLAEARALLAEHEWYVVEFYRKRERWPAVAARLEGILRAQPDSPRAGEALYGLAEAYLKMDERYEAQQALQKLIVEHPADPRRAPAEKLLASLR